MKTFFFYIGYIELLILAMAPGRAWGQADARLVEIGPNDFRITHTGTDGAPAFDALDPAVAYNAAADEYLVVWSGDDAVDGAFEIYGQRLDAATGAPVGSDDFLVASAPARYPAVVYNDAQREYLVVWEGEASLRAAEIYGQRLDAMTGVPVGTARLRISDMGEADTDDAFDARRPAVVYNDAQLEYLVVWEGDDVVDGAFEIYGQRLDAATGAPAGANDFRISAMGDADQDTAFGAYRPSVAYNPFGAEYLVVWLGNDDRSQSGRRAFAIFGQRLDAASGDARGDQDFKISAREETGAYAAAYPDVAYNPADAAYLVVWRGDHGQGPGKRAHEIYARRLSGDLSRPAAAQDEPFRLSDMGASDHDAGFNADHPAVVRGPDEGYFAVWSGDDDEDAADDEHEVFGQRIQAGVSVAGVLSAFTAEVDSMNAVRLAWVAEGAFARAGFEVQARAAGSAAEGAAWQVLDVVAGAGTTQARQPYRYRVEALPPGRHVFRLKYVDAVGAAFSNELEVLIEVPGDFFVSSAYPNPFNRATTVQLTLKERQHVEVAVFDMLGRRVATLYRGPMEANQVRSFQFEAGSHPSGAYFIHAVGDAFVKTQQVLLVR